MMCGYGIITDEMLSTTRPFIEGRTVVDFGAGDGSKARLLLEEGAGEVICVDKLPAMTALPWIQGYFAEVGDKIPESFDVALVSWPQNYRNVGLTELLERAKVVIYLGSNTDGSACGSPGLYKYFTTRELLAEVPHQRNTLLILGDHLDERRQPTPEELAGILAPYTLMSF